MTTTTCSIHPEEELYETNPADAESGPSVHDTENELRCVACDHEEEAAFWASSCIMHRRRLGDCHPACGLDMGAR